MRSIQQLLDEHESVWFWIPDEHRQAFCSELMQMEAVFLNGTAVGPESIGHCMAVHSSKTVAYVSNLVWYNTFFTPSACPVKVHYGKYLEGSPDYQLFRPNIRPMDISELLGGDKNV